MSNTLKVLDIFLNYSLQSPRFVMFFLNHGLKGIRDLSDYDLNN